MRAVGFGHIRVTGFTLQDRGKCKHAARLGKEYVLQTTPTLSQYGAPWSSLNSHSVAIPDMPHALRDATAIT
jgi:hypothetical protein